MMIKVIIIILVFLINAIIITATTIAALFCSLGTLIAIGTQITQIEMCSYYQVSIIFQIVQVHRTKLASMLYALVLLMSLPCFPTVQAFVSNLIEQLSQFIFQFNICCNLSRFILEFIRIDGGKLQLLIQRSLWLGSK